MRFLCLTREKEIGASCHVVEMEGRRWMLDAGLHPQLEGPEALPLLKAAGNAPLEAVFLTHAHLDHLGALPVVVKRWGARVVMSAPTATLTPVLLRNSVSIMEKRVEEDGGPPPLYGRKDVRAVEELVDVQPVGERVEEEGWAFELREAGHILGSASVLLECAGRRVLYTSDINLRDQTLMRRADLEGMRADVLIMETTRGATQDAADFSRERELERFAEALNRTWDRGGVTLVPVFALGKTQEVLMACYLMMESGALERVPIHIGGLSTALTEIYDGWAESPGRQHRGFELLSQIRPQTLNGRSRDLERPVPRHLYLLSSGMMTAGTSSFVMARSVLPREQDGIFFVGYCDPISPAGVLKATPRGGRAVLDEREGEQVVNCEVGAFDLTAHALRQDLVEFAVKVNPKCVVLVHGDVPALEWFEGELSRRLPLARVVVPEPGQWVDLG